MEGTAKTKRLSKVAREFNVGISTIIEFLHKKGIEIDSNPNAKVSEESYDLLLEEYSSDISVKKKSEELSLKREKKETISIDDIDAKEEAKRKKEEEEEEDEVLIKDFGTRKTQKETKKPKEPEKEEKVEKEEKQEDAEKEKIDIKIVGKVDLSEQKPKKKEEAEIKDTTAPKKDKAEEKEAEEKEETAADTPSVEAEETTPDTVEKPEAPETTAVEQAEEKHPEEKETPEEVKTEESEKDVKEDIKVVGKIDLSTINQKTRPARKTKAEKEKERKEREKEKEEAKKKKETEEKPAEAGKTVSGKKESATDTSEKSDKKKKKRKRIKRTTEYEDEYSEGKSKGAVKKSRKGKRYRPEISEEEVQQQIKETFARLSDKSKSKSVKYRKDKREAISQKQQEEMEKQEAEKTVLKVSEFVTVNELAVMMDVPVNEIISTCMGLGLFVSINQRLDAETLSMLAEEYGYQVEFVSIDVQEDIVEEEDKEEDLEPRPPIVTVMGHVDHGKTKLLDHIRKANVIAGEAGGITQHIGAYSVSLEGGRQITFLDTPGHEAFTAMRARGAQITDLAIIVVAADDGVMPQTVEAINHAQAAGVPLVIAINKIDKADANPDKIKEELGNMNILVEDWGGKYQSQEISAKQGLNIEELLEKVLLESEMLELKANPDKKASGAVIESTLDKGRGYVTTLLVQSGTLKLGDIVLAGCYTGHVKAMYNERGQQIDSVGPSGPVLILGLDGAPQAGDKFNVMDNDKEAKEVANKRKQVIREQGLRTHKHITLDEIGRRIAIGNFQELNVIVKGDVDGSIEALSDSLIKLSNEEIQVNVIHKAVGQILESDVMLAAASNAIIIGFQVRPSTNARKIAEKEEIDIRLYSIIYDAINELKDAMEGMLSPEIKEEIIGTAEIKETFKITKVGTIAGCQVVDGKIQRNNKVRVIRDGIVIYDGELGSLKRFKDDVKEVVTGLECGLNIDKYNDIKVGDMIEAYTQKEIKKKLS